jgi:hypothetical protein
MYDIATTNIIDLTKWAISTGRGKWIPKFLGTLQPADEDDLMQELRIVAMTYRERAATKNAPILYLSTKMAYRVKRWMKARPPVVEPFHAGKPMAVRETRRDTSGIWDYIPEELEAKFYGAKSTDIYPGVKRKAANNRLARLLNRTRESVARDPVFCDAYAGDDGVHSFVRSGY